MTSSSSTQYGFDTQAISTLQVPAGDRIGGDEARTLYSIGRRSAVQPTIRPYDFKRPERISQDQLRSLKSLHESFARNYGGQLTGMSRMIVAGQRPVFLRFFKEGYAEGHLVIETGEWEILGGATWTTGNTIPPIDRSLPLGSSESSNSELMYRVSADETSTAIQN